MRVILENSLITRPQTSSTALKRKERYCFFFSLLEGKERKGNRLHPMKAVVFHGIGDIRLDDVPEPTIEQPTDAIVRLTASAICGTDLHMIRGTFSGMVPGTILGHEGVGTIEQLSSDVRNLNVGDRVVIPSTIACGYCSYYRAGYYSQCDHANPNGPSAGTTFLGGPKATGAPTNCAVDQSQQ